MSKSVIAVLVATLLALGCATSPRSWTLNDTSELHEGMNEAEAVEALGGAAPERNEGSMHVDYFDERSGTFAVTTLTWEEARPGLALHFRDGRLWLVIRAGPGVGGR